MAAATLRPQMTAATEHGQEVLLLQSTAMSANVVFINIDWKASRHNKTLKANMELLGLTIAGVVRNMKPAMVCMCEVGEASIPLTEEQMQQVADQTMQAWRDAATEHVQLHCMFEVGAPYMTIYIDGPVQCSCHRILKGLYNAQGLPRTAQTFLCCGPGGVTVDVINVHAPSGKKKLTDQQRKTLLTNLLQSNSKSMPEQAIGSARFLIGGDMNTAPFLLSQLLQVCRDNGSLHTQAHIHEPVLGNHGDLCVLGGFKADSLATTAENHDPQHKPYGICWSMAQGSATPKIPTKAAPPAAPYATFGSPCMQRFAAANRDDKNIGYFKAPIDPHKEAAASYRPPPRIPLPSGLGYGPVSKGYATEQPLQAPPTPAPTREPPMPPAVGVTRRPQSWTPAVAAPAVADAAPQTTAATEPAPKWSAASDARTLASLAAEPDDDDDDHQPPMPWDRQRAASSAGYATEQPLQEHTPIDTRRQLHPPLSDQQKEWIRDPGPPSAAKSDGAAMAAMKMPLRSAVAENFQRASDEETAAAAAAAATEHSEDASTPELASQELPADKKMTYSIVNEFLGKITFNNPVAEDMLIAALTDESCLTPSMHLRVEEVFSRIFFHYPKGLKDRSVWETQDTSEYIRQWYKLASLRTFVNPGFAAATEHGEQLSKDQVSQIFIWYMEDMKTSLREDQLDRKWVYYKSCAEAKMKRQAGHTFVANAIWAIGLPRLPSFATEQRGKQLSAKDLEAVPEAINSVLNWLDRLASALTRHHKTNEYKDAARKSGVAHGQSGLTATEQETRRATRKAKFDIRTATALNRRWKDRTLTFKNWVRWQENLLSAYWDGSLQRRLEDALESQGNADPMCRTPLQPPRL